MGLEEEVVDEEVVGALGLEEALRPGLLSVWEEEDYPAAGIFSAGLQGYPLPIGLTPISRQVGPCPHTEAPASLRLLL